MTTSMLALVRLLLMWPELMPGANVEIPTGYEIIDIDTGNALFDVRMNSCGEVVYSAGLPQDDSAEIFLYDNGSIVQLTQNTERDLGPDINDSGTIIWARGLPETGYEIVRLTDGEELSLGIGSSVSLNALGHAVWKYLPDPVDCAAEANVFFYDGQKVTQITEDGRSNQSAEINDMDEIVWTSTDFCASPWTSEIHLYSGGEIQILPTMTSQSVVPSINNVGVVAWKSIAGIELWQDGITTLFTEWGGTPALNDQGHIYFIRFHQDVAAWQSWMYRDGTFHRLTDDTVWNLIGDINEWGECTWNWQSNINDTGDIVPGGIRMLRRVRNGDIDLDFAIDMIDYATFPQCLTGPGDFDRLCNCRFADMGHNRNVDLADFALFQNTFAHPQYPGHGCCDLNHGPGCNDESVQDCVCAVLPSCCTDEWTDTCVVLLEQLNCGECP